jgi:hypothetical protein
VSDPIDIKALDEYLKGGSDISQRYRELGREDVPPELDRRVLEEARAAVAGGGAARSRSWLRWSAPVALAASVVLVVAVVIESPVQDETIAIQPASEAVRGYDDAEEYKLQRETAQARQHEPELQVVTPEQPAALERAAAPPAAPPPANVAKAEMKGRDGPPVVEEVRVNAQAAREQSFAPSPVTVVDSAAIDSAEAQLAAELPAPTMRTQSTSVQSASVRNEADRAAGVAADSSANAETQLQEAVVTGTRQRRSAGRTAGPRNTISGSAFSSEKRPAADPDAEQIDPAKWLEEIRDLRRAGKIAEADRAWEQFREAFPNFPVKDDDVARKQP